MINNKVYLEKLLQSKDDFSVKVITGIRGVGKTKLLHTFAATLEKSGVSAEQIIYINFEEQEEIFDFQQLYEFVSEKIAYLEQAYLLLDEVQRVNGWEKAINAFFVGSPVDIYIAGSNSGILSKKFLHLLSERYELIKMQSVSFDNYTKIISDGNSNQIETSFKKYLKFGGLPVVMKSIKNEDILPALLSGMYNTILNKDIIARYGVRDVSLLNSINKFLAINIGQAITPKVINDYLKSIGFNTTSYTMENYLGMIDESGLFKKISRYDIKNKSKINGSERFYCSDLGLRNVLTNFNDLENEFLLENILCIKLFQQNYELFIGKIGSMKVNFVALKDSKPMYLQVISTTEDKKRLKKALNALQRIQDQYDKIILTMDYPKINDYNGIKVLNIFDFIIDDI